MLTKRTVLFILSFSSFFFWGCQSPTEPIISPDPTSPFGSLQVNVNADSALIKLKFNNSTLKQRNGTGILDSILPGTYTLETSAQYYYTDTSLIQIAANNRTIKNVELYKNVGSLNITVNVEDALIQLWKSNSLVKERRGSGIIDNILPGTYILKTSAALHVPDSSTVTILERVQSEKTVNLIHNSGTITFNVTPTYAIVKIYQNSILLREHDGAGKTDSLPSGSYTYTVEAPYFRTEYSAFVIKPGDKRILSFAMISIIKFAMVDINMHFYLNGCTTEQNTLCQNDELPNRNLLLSGYQITKLEVQQHIWELIMGYNNSTVKDSLLPVHNISWYEAIDFCNKLSIALGLMPCYTINGTDITCDWNANGYRLPTEAEWEAAARGGGINPNVQSKFSGANTLATVGWYSANSFSTVHYPGTKYGNRIAIYDLSGNVSEWCWDFYGAYDPSNLSNPKGAPSGTTRVVRGGSFLDAENACRVSARSSFPPETKSSTIGLRLVRKI